MNAYPDKTFQGTIVEILPVTRTTTNGATVSTARISLESSDIRFVAGLNGQANITEKESSNVMTIPSGCLS